MSCAPVTAAGGQGQTSACPASASSGAGPASTPATSTMGKTLPLCFSPELLINIGGNFSEQLILGLHASVSGPTADIGDLG